MYLPVEIDPIDQPLYLVVVTNKRTGAREVDTVTAIRERAERIARRESGYVLEIKTVADHR